MQHIALPSANGSLSTELIFMEKQDPHQDYHIAKIICKTSNFEGNIQRIGINDVTLNRFIHDLRRITYNGQVSLKLRTKSREEFSLHITHQPDLRYYMADVKLIFKSNYMYLKYQLDPTVIL